MGTVHGSSFECDCLGAVSFTSGFEFVKGLTGVRVSLEVIGVCLGVGVLLLSDLV